MLSDGEFEYIYGNNRIPIAQVKISNGEIKYLHADVNGSVTASTDVNGSLVGSVVYSPYGATTDAPVSKFGFAGEWTDATTGYSYLRARWLDTNTGTFLSEDPLTQSTGQAFGYTAGNPLQQVDPLGLCSILAGDLGNLGSDCYAFADTPTFKNIANGVTGFGDAVADASVLSAFGGTNGIRETFGLNGSVNTCSKDYTIGNLTGVVASFLIPGGGAIKAGGKFASKIIPKTAGNPLKNISNSINSPYVLNAGINPSQSIVPAKIKKILGNGNQEGVIYYRVDQTGNLLPYVGQAKSPTRFVQRKKEHAKKHPLADFIFEIIGRENVPNKQLSRMEEHFMRQAGGVDKLSNKRVEMRENNYLKAGGDY